MSAVALNPLLHELPPRKRRGLRLFLLALLCAGLGVGAFFDKRAWDRNHGCRFLLGGTAAIALAFLNHAMLRGRDAGIAADITEEILLPA